MEILIGFVIGLALGVLAAKLWRNGKDGTMYLQEVGEKKVFSLELEESPENLENRERVVFVVRRIAE